MTALILPRRIAHPTDLRLDGEHTGGNREVVGRFRHHCKVWKVHADTHYEPLIVAHEAMKKHHSLDPFTEKPTANGTSLVLTQSLRKSVSSKFKYLYIYEEEKTS
jgi:hypothetical protein